MIVSPFMCFSTIACTTLIFIIICTIHVSDHRHSKFLPQQFRYYFGYKCSLDFINNNELPQDDPCIIQIIREHFLLKPSLTEVSLNLSHPTVINPAENLNELNRIIKTVFHNKTGGFFIESGAHDGEYISNTIYMERFLGWTGILIEPNPYSFKDMQAKHRNAWTIPVCLSLNNTPTAAKFELHGILGHITDERKPLPGAQLTEIQCFPLYSILSAIEKTTVDFFSLDIGGDELNVLRTIPWDKVDIKCLFVDRSHIKEGVKSLVSYMESNGYLALNVSTSDVTFVKSPIG